MIFAVLAAVAALMMLFVLAEIMAAVLPLLIVVELVPPEQRRDLAELIAAYDSSRRLRVWPALRVAVAARRQGRDGGWLPHQDRGTPFDQARVREPLINTPREYDPERSHTPVGPQRRE